MENVQQINNYEYNIKFYFIIIVNKYIGNNCVVI